MCFVAAWPGKWNFVLKTTFICIDSSVQFVLVDLRVTTKEAKHHTYPLPKIPFPSISHLLNCVPTAHTQAPVRPTEINVYKKVSNWWDTQATFFAKWQQFYQKFKLDWLIEVGKCLPTTNCSFLIIAGSLFFDVMAVIRHHAVYNVELLIHLENSKEPAE